MFDKHSEGPVGSSRSRILLVASAAGLAGGERNLYDIARSLVLRGDWSVFAVVPANGPLKAALEELGCRVYVLPLPSHISPLSVKRLAGIIRENRIDLIHAHGTRAAFCALPTTRFARAKCVYTVHGIHYCYFRAPKRLIYIATERLMRTWVDRVIFVCKSDMKKGLADGMATKAAGRMIYNGVTETPLPPAHVRQEVRAELNMSDDEKLILNVGRFHRQKGQMYLVEAAAMVANGRPNARFILVGGGDTLGEVEQRAEQLELGGAARFLGPRHDVGRLMAAADVFVLSSLWEGLPYVLLEAALAELPIVATSVDGVPEMIVDGEMGTLVPPGDSQALAEAIDKTLGDIDKAKEMAKSARSRVLTDFSLDKMFEAVHAIYLELLGSEK